MWDFWARRKRVALGDHIGCVRVNARSPPNMSSTVAAGQRREKLPAPDENVWLTRYRQTNKTRPFTTNRYASRFKLASKTHTSPELLGY
jgi:hypothetical protein